MKMRRRTFVGMAAATGTALVAPVRNVAQAEAITTPQSGYAPVNGLRMYYEIHGTGEPLLLLHGAFGAIDLWGPILTTLAEHHQVIAVELQGHGHTADIIDRPLSYEQMADDVGLRDGEMVHHGRDVIRKLLVAEGAVDDVGRVAMALELHGDDLMLLGQGGQDWSPQVDRPEGAMEQQQRLPAAMDLVVHL